MNERMNRKDFLSLSFLLFAMFFGSGNLIFPPILGNQAAISSFTALLGFLVTAVVIPVLGILAVAKAGGVTNLGSRVGRYFSIIFPAIIFLSIGPGIAIPRNGSLAFEMSVAPYLGESSNLLLIRLAYTLIFFAVAFYLCLTPSKLVDRIGKVLTPALLLLLVVFFLGAVIVLTSNVGPVNEAYSQPFINGFLEGYNTMDALASLNFGFVVALAIRGFNIKNEKNIISYASKAGLIAGILLAIIYAMLTYVGMISSADNQAAANGGTILFNVTNQVFGNLGSVVLILIFTLACLTTVAGLITSVSEYFAELTKHKVNYKAWVTIFTLVSLVLANFGLDNILVFSVPILMAIYPPAIVLIVLALLQDKLNLSHISYKLTIYVTLFFSIIQGIETAGISVPVLSEMTSKLPLYNAGLQWLVPALIAFIVSLFIGKSKKK